MRPLFSFSDKIPIPSPYSTPSVPICAACNTLSTCLPHTLALRLVRHPCNTPPLQPALRSCRTSPFSASFSVPIRPRNPAAAKGKTALPHNGMTIGTDYE